MPSNTYLLLRLSPGCLRGGLVPLATPGDHMPVALIGPSQQSVLQAILGSRTVGEDQNLKRCSCHIPLPVVTGRRSPVKSGLGDACENRRVAPRLALVSLIIEAGTARSAHAWQLELSRDSLDHLTNGPLQPGEVQPIASAP